MRKNKIWAGSSKSRQRLEKLYEDLDCEVAIPKDRAEAVIQLLKWASETGAVPQVVVAVTDALPEIFRRQDKVTMEELVTAHAVQLAWADVTQHLPPMQPITWSSDVAASSDIVLAAQHSHFRQYLIYARGRIDKSFAPSFGGRTYEAVQPAKSSNEDRGDRLTEVFVETADGEVEITETFIQYVKSIVDAAAQIRQRGKRGRPTKRDMLLSMEFIHLRQASYLRAELAGIDSGPILGDLNYALEELLPLMRPTGIRALGEALSFINECILSHLVGTLDMVAAGQTAPVLGDKTMEILRTSLAYEIWVWDELKDLTSRVATHAAYSWFYSRYWPTDSSVILKHLFEWLDGRRIDNVKIDNKDPIKWMARQCPIAAIVWLTELASKGLSSSEQVSRPIDSYESQFFNTCDDLLPYSGNPSRLPLDIRYRSIVRAELAIRPPVAVFIESLFAASRVLEGLRLATMWWAAVMPSIKRKSAVEDFTPWREELVELAESAMHQQEERGLLPTDTQDHFIDLARRLAEVGYRIEGVYNVDEFELAEAKSLVESHLEHIAYEYIPVTKIAGSIRGGLERLQDQADNLEVDLLVLVVTNERVLFSLRPAGSSSWQVAAVDAPRWTLIAMGRYIGRRAFGATPLFSELLNDPGEHDVPEPSEAALDLARMYSQLIVEHFDLGPRLAVIVPPELSHIPIVAALSAAVCAEMPSGAVAELDASCLWKPEVQSNSELVIKRYTAFVLNGQPAEEIIWNSLGVPGGISKSFAGTDVMDALELPDSVVHVVTHGLFDEYDPMLSMLATDDGQHWMIIDLFGRSFSASLLILNACSTAATGSYGSVFGPSFVRQALDYGVRAVVGNALPVETRDAKEFAEVFEERIVNFGASPAQAFADAVSSVDSHGGQYPMTLISRSLPALFRPVRVN
jgi:hypothetical protein